MSETPLTDLKRIAPLDIQSCLDFCERIERKLTAALRDNKQLQECNRLYGEDKLILERDLAAAQKQCEQEAIHASMLFDENNDLKAKLARYEAAGREMPEEPHGLHIQSGIVSYDYAVVQQYAILLRDYAITLQTKLASLQKD